MTRHLWKGPGEMEQINLTRAQAPEVTEPTSPTEELTEHDKARLFVCTAGHESEEDACGRKFKKRMILARHFNSSHEDLREDKDSWREYVEEVWV